MTGLLNVIAVIALLALTICAVAYTANNWRRK